MARKNPEPRIEITELERGESPRADRGLFGKAVVHDTTNGRSEIAFSRLDGEDIWHVDATVIEGYVLFRRSPGYRLGKRYTLTGWMSEIIDAEVKARSIQ